jgi:hypothetical protein
MLVKAGDELAVAENTGDEMMHALEVRVPIATPKAEAARISDRVDQHAQAAASHVPSLLFVRPPPSIGDDKPYCPGATTVDARQIEKDLPRTFSDQPHVASCVEIVEAVLLEYAAADPEVGYCQGMNCVAAVVCVQFPDASKAYLRFWKIVSNLRGLWLPGFPLLLRGVTAFDELFRISLPDLSAHFVENSVTVDMFDMFLPETWLTLFSRWLPFSMLWGIFEFIEAESFPGVLSLTAALLQEHTDAIMKAQDFTSLFMLLKSLSKQPRQPQSVQLLASARAFLPAAQTAFRRASGGEESIPRSTSTPSLLRQGSRVIHEPSGLELLRGDGTSSDATWWQRMIVHSSKGGAAIGPVLMRRQVGGDSGRVSMTSQPPASPKADVSKSPACRQRTRFTGFCFGTPPRLPRPRRSWNPMLSRY